MKKIIFVILVSLLLCSGIVCGMNLYKSVDIQYTPSDETWEVNNVSEALNSLYDMMENSSSVIHIPTLTFSSSCSANSSMGAGSSVSTNTVSVSSSTTSQFTFSIKDYSKLSIENGSCTYTLKDSTNALSDKTGTLNSSGYISIIGYDTLVLSYSINCSGSGISTHNSSASGSNTSTLTNLRIE